MILWLNGGGKTASVDVKPTVLLENLPDVRVIWGRLLREIKKENKIMLHSACLKLGQVEVVEDRLVVRVPNKLDYEILKKPQNSGELVETLSKLGYNLGIEFVLDEKAGDTLASKLDKLCALVGVDLKII